MRASYFSVRRLTRELMTGLHRAMAGEREGGDLPSLQRLGGLLLRCYEAGRDQAVFAWYSQVSRGHNDAMQRDQSRKVKHFCSIHRVRQGNMQVLDLYYHTKELFPAALCQVCEFELIFNKNV